MCKGHTHGNSRERWRRPLSVRHGRAAEDLVHFLRGVVYGGDLPAMRQTRETRDPGCLSSRSGKRAALSLPICSEGRFLRRKRAQGSGARLTFPGILADERLPARAVGARRAEELSYPLVQVFWLCQEADPARRGHIALAGTRLKADASCHTPDVQYAETQGIDVSLATEHNGAPADRVKAQRSPRDGYAADRQGSV